MIDLLKTVMPYAGWTAVAICALGLALTGMGLFPGPLLENEPVPITKTGTLPIDAPAPAQIETATFALG